MKLPWYMKAVSQPYVDKDNIVVVKVRINRCWLVFQMLCIVMAYFLFHTVGLKEI